MFACVCVLVFPSLLLDFFFIIFVNMVYQVKIRLAACGCVVAGKERQIKGEVRGDECKTQPHAHVYEYNYTNTYIYTQSLDHNLCLCIVFTLLVPVYNQISDHFSLSLHICLLFCCCCCCWLQDSSGVLVLISQRNVY